MAASTSAPALEARRPAFGWKRLPAWLRHALLLALLIGAWQAYVIGAAIAAALTAFATLTKVGEDLLTLLTSILNPLPGVAVLPLAMLWFGITTNAILFVIGVPEASTFQETVVPGYCFSSRWSCFIRISGV